MHSSTCLFVYVYGHSWTIYPVSWKKEQRHQFQTGPCECRSRGQKLTLIHTSGWMAAKLHNKGLSGKHIFVFFFILVTVNHTHFILSETENTHTSVSLMLTYSQGLSPNWDDLYREKLLIVVNLVLSEEVWGQEWGGVPIPGFWLLVCRGVGDRQAGVGLVYHVSLLAGERLRVLPEQLE